MSWARSFPHSPFCTAYSQASSYTLPATSPRSCHTHTTFITYFPIYSSSAIRFPLPLGLAFASPLSLVHCFRSTLYRTRNFLILLHPIHIEPRFVVIDLFRVAHAALIEGSSVAPLSLLSFFVAFVSGYSAKSIPCQPDHLHRSHLPLLIANRLDDIIVLIQESTDPGA